MLLNIIRQKKNGNILHLNDNLKIVYIRRT